MQTDNNNREDNSRSTRRACPSLIVIAMIICSVLFAGYLWDCYAAQSHTIATVAPASQLVKKPVFKKIQEIEAGDRTVGKNPEITNIAREFFIPDPDPVTWRKLILDFVKPGGKRVDIVLLRPSAWIDECEAAVGKTIYLDLPEMGTQGNALVVAIESCPNIKPGQGNVVTGTFHHEATNTVNVIVKGKEAPIGTTDNHPFWSETRQDFVEAGKLDPGEELLLYDGQTAQVIQTLPRPGPERVYNIEVLNENVYLIGETGVLVHNQCVKWNQMVNKAGGVITIRNKKLAGKTHPKTGVKFDDNGFPDFSPHAKETITFDHDFQGYAKDFAEADKAFGINAEYRQQNGLTWHHDVDGRTMRLIPKEIHNKTGHTGGLAILGLDTH